jgi:hypothetical protein
MVDGKVDVVLGVLNMVVVERDHVLKSKWGMGVSTKL